MQREPLPLRVRAGARVAVAVAVTGVALALLATSGGGCASKQEREARREAKRLRHLRMEPGVARGLASHPAPVAGVTPASPVMTSTPRFMPIDATDSAAPASALALPAAHAFGLPAFQSNAWASAGAAGATRYTVMKGDTLFGIARARYGNGGQWQRIAMANPGLTPETLKAGTTILVP